MPRKEARLCPHPQAFRLLQAIRGQCRPCARQVRIPTGVVSGYSVDPKGLNTDRRKDQRSLALVNKLYARHNSAWYVDNRI